MAERQSSDQSENETEREFEVTVRRGNDDHLEVLTISTETEKAAEREALSRNGVRKVVPGTTVEFGRDEDGGRVYGNFQRGEA